MCAQDHCRMHGRVNKTSGKVTEEHDPYAKHQRQVRLVE